MAGSRKHPHGLQWWVAGLLVAACLLSALLPVVDAMWKESLSVQGEIATGAWTTPTPIPEQGTSLVAEQEVTGSVVYEDEDEEGEDEESRPHGAGIREGIMPPRWQDERVHRAEGEVCVTNTGEVETVGLQITGTLEYKPHGGEQYQPYLSVSISVDEHPVLSPGETYCYAFRLDFAPPLEDEMIRYRWVSHVTILNHAGWLPGDPHCPGPDLCPYGPTVRTDFVVSDEAPKPTLTPTPTPTPEATVTPTPEATETGSPPTPTPTSQPTETPEPTPTPGSKPTEGPPGPPPPGPPPRGTPGD